MRLIDADAFKNYLQSGLEDVKHLFKDNGKRAGEVVKGICEDIDEQPTIELPHWIPCSERLPEPNRHDALNVDVYYLAQTEFGDMIVASYNESHKGTKWWEQMYSYRIFDDEIVAWMPLPDPYCKTESHEREGELETVDGQNRCCEACGHFDTCAVNKVEERNE